MAGWSQGHHKVTPWDPTHVGGLLGGGIAEVISEQEQKKREREREGCEGFAIYEGM